MLRKLFVFCLFTFTVLTLFLFAAQPAQACVMCAYHEGARPYWSCEFTTGSGGQSCQLFNGGCQTFYTCFGNGSGCPPTGCPAGYKPNKKCASLRHAALKHPGRIVPVGATEMTEAEVLNDFVAKIESGKFSGKDSTLYLGSDSNLAHSLLDTVSTDHWQSFLAGFETGKDGVQHKVYYLTTKKGYKVHIILLDPPKEAAK